MPFYIILYLSIPSLGITEVLGSVIFDGIPDIDFQFPLSGSLRCPSCGQLLRTSQLSIPSLGITNVERDRKRVSYPYFQFPLSGSRIQQ